ncbi:hypothetical protein MMC09_002169 [Bachmanniomyces sp. S44760]|nr:hypothetical protein [Bachmanniomyces sp. S44760]
MANLPYNPTAAFLSASDNGTSVLIIQPPSNDYPDGSLLALNISGTVLGTTQPSLTITNTLPFVKGNSTSYTALTDGFGRLYSWAGSCSEGPDGASLWTFDSQQVGKDKTEAWNEQKLSPTGDQISQGPKYLASGIAFANPVNSTSEVYVFGGMCPNSTSGTQGDWQTSAAYSDAMLSMQPQSVATGTSDYILGTVAARAPPIPEAGFTITPLEPAYVNSTAGSMSQQQNFVLLGGHTQQAFINMSQVALFSLPETSWTFLPVDGPSQDNVKTDLAIRTTPSVDSRSGHTALLTSDGRSIVVFGGWVGDIATAASPQLAVLNLGEGYGGAGNWQWTVPSSQGQGLANGASLYGHGAVMLPGGVMMVVGGFTIPPSNAGPGKRAASVSSTTNYFFNVTSNSWIATYVHPEASASHLPPSASSSHLTSSTRAGLGAGLAFSLAALAGAAIVYFWYSRRLKRRKEAREKELRHLSINAHRFNALEPAARGIDGRGGENSAADWFSERQTAQRDAYPWAPVSTTGGSFGEGPGWRENGGSDVERTGLLVEIPSPTRGLRRSLQQRSMFSQPDPRRPPGSSNIHPIDERDEYEEEMVEKAPHSSAQIFHGSTASSSTIRPVLDPFRDSPVFTNNHHEHSRTPSPESPTHERELEVQNWVSDWTAAEARMHHQAGRISPDKTDRTSSTLSDLSTLSNMSARSYQRSLEGPTRTLSQRSAALFSSNPFASSATPPTCDLSGVESLPTGPQRSSGRSQSLTLNAERRQAYRSDAFATASSSFAKLQSEGETLLGGPSARRELPPLNARTRARGWAGSIRRALVGPDRGPSTSPDGGGRSTSSSPIKAHHTEGDMPRRAASTGSTLLRGKQGARDWDVEQREDKVRGTDHTIMQDDDWDVESAVERRVVQVMFTVPKEKLRVVNGGEGDTVSIASTDREGARNSHDEAILGKEKK